jgi:hypothetical protein
LRLPPLASSSETKRQPIELSDFVDLHNVWMLKTGYSLGFQLKAGNVLWVCKRRAADHLECHYAPQTHLSSLVYDAHTSAAQDA